MQSTYPCNREYSRKKTGLRSVMSVAMRKNQGNSAAVPHVFCDIRSGIAEGLGSDLSEFRAGRPSPYADPPRSTEPKAASCSNNVSA